MRTTPGPAEFLRIVAAVGWPRVPIGSCWIEGEAAWRAAPLVPHERRAVLAWLGRRDLLAVTPVARRRLRAWLDARKVTPPPRPRPWRITRLRYYGDELLLPVLADALDALPEPVAAYVAHECVVLGVGRGTAGWTSGRLPDGRSIVLGGSLPDVEVRRVFLHEAAHCWTLEEPEAPTAVEGVQARHRADVRGWRAEIDAALREHEDLADWLAAAWEAARELAAPRQAPERHGPLGGTRP